MVEKENQQQLEQTPLPIFPFLSPPSFQDQPAVMPFTRAASPLSTLLCKILSIFSQSWFSPHSFFSDNPGLLFFIDNAAQC